MVDANTIAAAIAAHPAETEAALLALPNFPFNSAGIRAEADRARLPFEIIAADMILAVRRGEEFVNAMRARGVLIVKKAVRLRDANWPDRQFAEFLSRIAAHRCRILVNGQAAGSGCLIGRRQCVVGPQRVPWDARPRGRQLNVDFRDVVRRQTPEVRSVGLGDAAIGVVDR